MSNAGISDLLQNNASTLSLTSASCGVSAASTSNFNQTFTVVNSPGGFGGTIFTGLPDRTVFSAVNGRSYLISYTGTAVTLQDQGPATPTLNTGDLVVTGWNAVTNTITLTALADIPAATLVFITDRGWSDSNAFTSSGTGDTQVTWTPSATVSTARSLASSSAPRRRPRR